jgi:protein O-GlcNAc transferase
MDASVVDKEFALAVERHRRGDLGGAEQVYREILSAAPDHVGSMHNLGLVLYQRGCVDEAIAVYRRALDAAPDFVEACNSLGIALERQRRFAEAEEAYRRALALKPDLANAHSNLGDALFGQSRLHEAEEAYRTALRLRPDWADGYIKLGLALMRQQRLSEAEVAYRHALRLAPDLAGAYVNLGNVLEVQGRAVEAEEVLRRALQLQPDYAGAYVNLGVALKTQGRPAEAIAAYRRALALEPTASTHMNIFGCMHYVASFSAEDFYTEARRWNTLYAKPLAARTLAHDNDRVTARRLRIGYVSSDFHRHPVGFFVLPVFANHDKERFEIVAYADVRRRDELTERFAGYADYWHEVAGLDDEALAAMIRTDHIDVLVDLAGHTGENRLLVFARKPAPIQVSGGGNNDTTGLDAMDYLLSDRFHTPAGSERYFSETLIRLPNDYVCYGPPDYAPAVASPPRQRQGHVTFGCFNNLAKINSEVIALWSRILKLLPQARLRLQTRELNDAGTRERYRSLFAAASVEPRRVDLAGQVSHKRLLANYGDIDIALDPFPYTGGLTTCEALWMGVPVITLTGNTFVGRHSTSHLSNVGLHELITSTPEDYLRVAVELAHDGPRLSALRQSLRARVGASPLCDALRYTRDLEAAYRQMWERWCEQKSSAR